MLFEFTASYAPAPTHQLVSCGCVQGTPSFSEQFRCVQMNLAVSACIIVPFYA